LFPMHGASSLPIFWSLSTWGQSTLSFSLAYSSFGLLDKVSWLSFFFSQRANFTVLLTPPILVLVFSDRGDFSPPSTRE